MTMLGKQAAMPVYMAPEKRRALDALAKRLGVNRQSLVREGIDLVLAKRATKERQSGNS